MGCVCSLDAGIRWWQLNCGVVSTTWVCGSKAVRSTGIIVGCSHFRPVICTLQHFNLGALAADYPNISNDDSKISKDDPNISNDPNVSNDGQHIEILELEQFGKALFIDNEIQVAEKDEHLYSSTFVNAGLDLNSNKEKAAIIGGGDGGVARECISKNFGFIDWYELDPEVVDVCDKHLGKIADKATEKNSVKCVWGDAFESIKSVKDDTYDQIYVDLNDDQYCIDLASKNMDSLARILKPKGVITAQVGSQDKKPKQVENWLNIFNENFGNTKLSRVYIPSFDCAWNFSSSINH